MDRFGLFVDAGYLLASGGDLCCQTKRRHEIQCDYERVHRALVDRAQDECGLPHLRTYWYDGGLGPHSQPTVDQLAIAGLPRVKVRLGRVINGQQKGVDSMITRDLMTLARERAIAVAYLLSGDEDLREGVLAAQELGVQVILLGVTARTGVNQSFTLINECDGHDILDRAFLSAYFGRREADERIPSPLQPVAEGGTEDEVASNVGRRFAEQWYPTVEPRTARLVASRFPSVPRDIDAIMLRTAEATLGSLKEREDLRRVVRNAFIDRLSRLLGEGPP